MSSELDQDLKVSIATQIIPITYGNNTILMFVINSLERPVYYKEKLYIRSGNSTVEVNGSKVASVFALFPS